MKFTKVLFCVLLFVPTFSQAKIVNCYPKAEIAEDYVSGANLFEREAGKTGFKSRFDFNNLTLTDLQKQSQVTLRLVAHNVYEYRGSGFLWRYVTNDSKTIIAEATVSEVAIYSKIHFCK